MVRRLYKEPYSAFSAALWLAGSVAAQEVAAPDPHKAAAGMVRNQMGQFQAQEDAIDYTELLLRKERHDTALELFLLPLLNRADSTGLGVYEHDYSRAPSPTRHWLSTASAEPYGVRLLSESVIGSRYPCVSHADVRKLGSAAHVDILWHEPFFASGGSGFCLSPSGTRLVVDTDKMEAFDLLNGGSGGHTPRTEQFPFRNPENIYHWIDAAQVVWAAYGAGSASPASSVQSPLADAVTSVHIAPYPVKHETYYEIKTNTSEPIEGVSSTFRPTRILAYLEGGRDVMVRTAKTSGPAEVTVSADGCLLTFARYEPAMPSMPRDGPTAEQREAVRRQRALFVAVDGHDKTFMPTFYEVRDLQGSDRLAVRLRIEHNVRAAAWIRDDERLAAGIAAYGEVLQLDGVESRFLIYNLESLGEWCDRFVQEADLDKYLSTQFLPVVRKESLASLIDHAARAIAQGRTGYAALYLALAPQTDGWRDLPAPLQAWCVSTATEFTRPHGQPTIEPKALHAACMKAAATLSSKGPNP